MRGQVSAECWGSEAPVRCFPTDSPGPQTDGFPEGPALCLGEGNTQDWLNSCENVAGVDLQFDSQK